MAGLAISVTNVGLRHPCWVAVLPILLLVSELVITVGLRLVARRSPFEGDGVHLTTTLRRRGLTEFAVLVSALLFTDIGCLAAIWISFTSEAVAVVSYH